jgi:DNA protecting protein DprA
MIQEKDILALLLTKGLGPKGVSRIISSSSAQGMQVDLSSMSTKDMTMHLGIKADIAEQIPSSIKKANELLKEFESERIKMLIRGREGYPERLLKTLGQDAPLVLYAKGNLQILKQKAVGFCGSRKASEKGLAVAGECAGELAKRHINVISGYAHGIDLAAHRSALEAGGMTTFVLAEGIMHFKLKREVKELITDDNHVVVSEYMPRLHWLARNAMQRNKTICGLSNAVVVIESGLKGGTFEAGKTALALKRPLFVVEYAQPANSAEGNTYFLKQGAKFLRKKNGSAYLEDLFESVERDENGTTERESDTPHTLYGEDTANRDKEESLSVWERTAPYPEGNSPTVSVRETKPTYPKRLIEVDLPIKKISEHARREKSIRHGHISTLHIWWARRPLAACRAVICASLWPDPGENNCPSKFKTEAAKLMKKFRDKRGGKPYKWDDGVELRKALLDFIADFANWDNSTNKDFLETSWALTQVAHESLGGEPGTRPLVVDPFAGGGSIPLEALRVGADAFASDLNPVAVLLNKVVLEYIPKYGQRLADEVLKWGEWIKKEAENELAEFYPKDPDGATPIAYLWARTIKCEGPGCGAEVPLIRSLWLAKKGNRSFALRMILNSKRKSVSFEIIENANAKDVAEGTVRRSSCTCPFCGYTTPAENVRKQFIVRDGGADDAMLTTVVCQPVGNLSITFRKPNENDLTVFLKVVQLMSQDRNFSLVPKEPLPYLRSIFNVNLLGIDQWGKLHNRRQCLALITLVEKTKQAIKKIRNSNEDETFSIAVGTCLSLVVDRCADYWSSLAVWAGDFVAHTFGRQALGIVWDYAEVAGFSGGSGSYSGAVEWVYRCLARESSSRYSPGHVERISACEHPLPNDSVQAFITDPPYYDAVPYADLSDFFYVWLKRTIGDYYDHLFTDLLSPKEGEIVQLSERNPKYAYKTQKYFEDLMRKAMSEGRRLLEPNGIGVVVFAHKSTTGWETQLNAMIDAGWVITGSWPIDTERPGRLRANNAAALASSIHLVCRPRENPDGSLKNNEVGDWRDVLAELPKRIHEWMPRLAEEGVVGADAIFACLGPALEIFSRYSRVEKASGEVVPLKEYLEHVWAAVAKEALNMIFEGAETTGFEEDARLTAMWLWTLSTGNGNGKENPPTSPFVKGGEIEEDEDEEDTSLSKAKLSGYTLEYDAARKIAQGLGAHLERLQSLVEVKGDKARLLPVAERTKALFGKDEADAPRMRKKKKEQLSMFAEIQEAEEAGAWGAKNVPQLGNTTLDRLHQAMILFAAGRGEALKRFLVEEGVGRDERFWRLAQALSALYPKNTDEKRWVDGVLARKKGLGF